MQTRISSAPCVLPTRVGMVRRCCISRIMPRRSPHACGDGPRRQNPAELVLMFSPRVWGWSGDARVFSNHHLVLPTRVGMVRTTNTLGIGASGYPALDRRKSLFED